MSHQPAANNTATFCASEVRARDFGRYASTLFANLEQRRALLALYAFNAEIASVRDHISQPLPGEIRLQWWIDALTSAGHGSVQGNPVAAELLKTIETFDLPVDDLVHLIDTHRFDLYDDPMTTIEALESYLISTDSTLLSLAARICAPHIPQPDESTHHAGLAQGLVRIISLLPVHAARRQLYLPQQLLELNAATSEDIFAGKATSELHVVLMHIVRKARAHLSKALGHLAVSHPAQCLPFLPLALVQKTLERMEQTGFNPFQQSQDSRLSILWTLWRASRRVPFNV